MTTILSASETLSCTTIAQATTAELNAPHFETLQSEWFFTLSIEIEQ